MHKAFSFLFLLCVTVAIGGCRLAVIVVEGGEVQSTDAGTCAVDRICIVDIDDTNFAETFVAAPATGWYFQKWQQGDRFFCGNSPNPRCVLSLAGLEGNEAVQNLVASSELFYLMPVFRPYANTVIANGKRWFQPQLFSLSWDEINDVCPGGPCVPGARLNGYDMTGWTWASANELNALFNHYLGANILGPGPAEYEWRVEGDAEGDNPPPNRDFADDFYGDGWRATEEGPVTDADADNNPNYRRLIAGWVNDAGAPPYTWAFFRYTTYPWGFEVKASTRLIVASPDAENQSAWFYRAP